MEVAAVQGEEWLMRCGTRAPVVSSDPRRLGCLIWKAETLEPTFQGFRVQSYNRQMGLYTCREEGFMIA